MKHTYKRTQCYLRCVSAELRDNRNCCGLFRNTPGYYIIFDSSYGNSRRTSIKKDLDFVVISFEQRFVSENILNAIEQQNIKKVF